jgi:hypothetical protein
MSGIEETLSSILSPDNVRRKQGETVIETSRKETPKELMQGLYTCMSNAKDDVAKLACVLIKQNFLEGDIPDEQTLRDLEHGMFNILDTQRNILVLHAQGGVIVRVFSKLNDFKTLIEKIIELGKHEDPAFRELSMYMLEILVDVHIPQEHAKENINDFKSIFWTGLEDPDLKVRISSLKATGSFITSLDDPE